MEMNDTKEVRNENFDLNLKHGLCSSFTEQEFCDMTFAVGNHLYNAHKIVLSISSLYLKNILLASPTKYPIVVLSDVRPKILEYLLQFMYCGSVEVPENDIDDFLSSGKNLHIKGLQTISLDHVKLPAKDSKNISCEDDIMEVPPASTITFCPDSIKTFKPPSNLKRKIKPNSLNTASTKKSKKRHSVSFKIEPDVIKDNDDEMFPYYNENIMEPEVRIQDDFNKDDKLFNDISIRGPDIPQESFHAGNIDSADTKFVKGVSGKLHLVCNNYTFHKNTMRKDRVYWLCAAYHSPLQCRARCVTIEGKVVSITGYHNHETDYKERLSISSDSTMMDSSMVENLSFGSENNLIFSEKYLNNAHPNNSLIANNEHSAHAAAHSTSEFVNDAFISRNYPNIRSSIIQNDSPAPEQGTPISKSDTSSVKGGQGSTSQLTPTILNTFSVETSINADVSSVSNRSVD